MFPNRNIFKGLVGAAALLLTVWLAAVLFESGDKKIIIREGAVTAESYDPFANIFLQAKAAYVWDVARNKVLYADNEEAQLPLASLAKVMTAVLAAELVPQEEVITVGFVSVAQEGDSGLLVDERWELKPLIDLTLVSSSNDGAHALASAVVDFLISEEKEDAVPRTTAFFIDTMNQKAREIGLRQTFFVNESGLDANKGVSGAYGSARDLALLLEYALRNHSALLGATRRREQELVSLDGVVHQAENTNDRVETIPGIVASKTGFTDLAGGNLAIIFEKGPMHPIIAVVLGSTEEERFTDMEKLVQAALSLERYHSSLTGVDFFY